MGNSLKVALIGFGLAMAFTATANAGKAAKAQKPDRAVTVGGAAMYASKDIIDNAVNSQDHTTLVAAVKAADLVATSKSAGPFTVFAPSNDAFSKLPASTVESLLKPESKATLQKILKYHVIPGRLDSRSLSALIEKSKGKDK